MSEPEEIAARIEELLGEEPAARLAPRPARARLGGRDREPLDSVRFVGNRSSGRMGVALAEEARAAARSRRSSPRT